MTSVMSPQSYAKKSVKDPAVVCLGAPTVTLFGHLKQTGKPNRKPPAPTTESKYLARHTSIHPWSKAHLW